VLGTPDTYPALKGAAEGSRELITIACVGVAVPHVSITCNIYEPAERLSSRKYDAEVVNISGPVYAAGADVSFIVYGTLDPVMFTFICP